MLICDNNNKKQVWRWGENFFLFLFLFFDILIAYLLQKTLIDECLQLN